MPDDAGSRRLQVALTDASGRPVRVGALAAWLREVAPVRARGVVTVAFVSDAAMRRLNREFAGKDHATDVLSFVAADRGPGLASTQARESSRHVGDPRPTGRPHRPDQFLGDIVIATGIARRQAREAGHSYACELRVLALHGLLHLLGYDHETDGGTMARVEGRLRRKGGLTAGVIERARTT
jgi:probable rRNA maturation factor